MQTGHCFCGAVTWSHKGKKTRNLNCHCDECRRGVSGAFSAVIGLSAEELQIDGPWADYKYTPESSRAFCTQCGTRMWFRSELWPDEVFMNIGACADPAAHMPDQHVMTRGKVPWVVLDDAIPSSEGFQQSPKQDDPQTDQTQPDDDNMTGRCLCGQVHWTTETKPIWSEHCHCDSCRRATGAPFASFMGLRKESVSWTGEMTQYASSDGKVQRKFCSNCGTHMSYEADIWPKEIHVYAASLNDPSLYKPNGHVFSDGKLPWLSFGDGLPNYKATADGLDPTT